MNLFLDAFKSLFLNIARLLLICLHVQHCSTIYSGFTMELSHAYAEANKFKPEAAYYTQVSSFLK